MEELSNLFGPVAALLFIVANAYYPARVIARRFTPWSKGTVRFFKRYLQAHITLNLLGFLALILHVQYAEERNIFLIGSFVATLVLTIEGILMSHRMIPGMQRQLRMLHTQQRIFILWIILIVIGHGVL